MIPIWVMPFFNTPDTEEFLYNGNYMISIKGKILYDEWIIDIRVNAFPYFAWGCNEFHTGMKGLFKSVVRYYLTLVLNQLSEYGAANRKEILSIMRDYLE